MKKKNNSGGDRETRAHNPDSYALDPTAVFSAWNRLVLILNRLQSNTTRYFSSYNW